MAKNGIYLIKPTTVDKTGAGSTATISANGSVTFDNCASLSLNGVFSTDYDNYMVVAWQQVNGATYDGVYYRLRSFGTDNTTASSYVYQYLYASSATVQAARNTTTFWYNTVAPATYPAGSVGYFYGPYLSQPTAQRIISSYDISGPDIWDVVGTHNQSTSYDGFTMYPSTTTGRPIKGRVAVYGMRK